MPALNEEDNIELAIENTLMAFKNFNVNGEIVVVNDGSTDKTPMIIKQKMEKNPEIIRTINHSKPEGIGGSFWDGVEKADGDIVCMLPGDNENDPNEIIQYIQLLEHVDIIIPFIYNRWIRSKFRNFLSNVYRFIINTTFGVSLNYTNGTVMYRKAILSDLNYKCKGFFFQTDILIRLVKIGYLFSEVPYCLGIRKSGTSKAISFQSFFKIVKGYLKLVKDIYFGTNIKLDKKRFSYGSSTFKRYNVE
jgi:glycosyltransferase involved in cell wall biosynthesis